MLSSSFTSSSKLLRLSVGPISPTKDIESMSSCLSDKYGNIAFIDRMNSPGVTGEPYGMPACLLYVFPLLPSMASIACLSDGKESTQRTMSPAMPILTIRLSSCRLFTRSKAPLISSSSVTTICFRCQASSTKVTNFVTASDVLLPWRRPNWPL
jgi:hypothetical protein